MRIAYLYNYPQLYPQVAAWIFAEFGFEFEGGFADWLETLIQGQQDGTITTFVALLGSTPIATASLDLADFAPRSALSPWLASVYTLPEFRSQGIAADLVQRVEAEARVQGYPSLYLHTRNAMPFYTKRGWQTLEQVEHWNQINFVMLKDI